MKLLSTAFVLTHNINSSHRMLEEGCVLYALEKDYH